VVYVKAGKGSVAVLLDAVSLEALDVAASTVEVAAGPTVNDNGALGDIIEVVNVVAFAVVGDTLGGRRSTEGDEVGLAAETAATRDALGVGADDCGRVGAVAVADALDLAGGDGLGGVLEDRDTAVVLAASDVTTRGSSLGEGASLVGRLSVDADSEDGDGNGREDRLEGRHCDLKVLVKGLKGRRGGRKKQ